jgi:hypothetical protein
LTQTVVKVGFIAHPNTAIENDGILDHYEAKSSGSDVNPEEPGDGRRFWEVWID